MKLMDASPMFRDVLSFYNMALMICSAWAMITSVRQKKRPSRIILCLVLFGLSYFMIQILRQVTEHILYGVVSEVALIHAKGSLALYLLLMFSLTILNIFAMVRCFAWNRHHVNHSSVKESIDSLPSGIAIFSEDGSCRMVNQTMNDLSAFLSGHPAMDGWELYRDVEKHNMKVEMNGKYYAFHHRMLEYLGVMFHELIADDVTELHERTEELKKGNQQLEEIAEKMKKYGDTIDDTVRKREILQAKVNIHDEMNRLLLATGNAASNGVSREELHTILRTWQNNALLLCKEADLEPKSNAFTDLETLAKLIGIELYWEGKLEHQNADLLKLFERITREAITNAVKHGAAKTMRVVICEKDTEVVVQYINDGKTEKKDVRPGGGLKNIQSMLEQIGGHMIVSVTPQFTLTTVIPMGGTEHGL